MAALGQEAAVAELQPVPFPDLDALEPAVAGQLREMQELLASAQDSSVPAGTT